MTGLTTTIQSGFARSRSEALHPRLFPDAGWWCPSLQSPGGTRLHDLRGGNWGTLTNMDSATDWVVSGGRGALDFDGSNDRAETTATYSGLISGKIFTLSFWMRTSATNTNAYPFAFGSSASDTPYCGFRMSTTGAGTIALFFRDNAGNFVVPGDATVVNNGQWNHVVAVANGLTAQLYVNGRASGSASSIGSLGASTANRVTIGALGRISVVAFYSGLVDDARIYRDPLTLGDVRQLWQLGRGNMPTVRKRRYTEEAAATTNRRRRLICGSNC